jgi:hypothetical protein
MVADIGRVDRRIEAVEAALQLRCQHLLIEGIGHREVQEEQKALKGSGAKHHVRKRGATRLQDDLANAGVERRLYASQDMPL